MNRFASQSLCCLCLIGLFSIVARAADEQPPPQTPPAMEQPKPAAKGATIKAEEAKNNIGNEVVVEFVVVAGRELEDKGYVFLNSSTDRDDPAGFTAFITKKGTDKFKKDANIDHPFDHFRQKKIRVSGKIEEYGDNKKLEIKVNSPDQIKIVEEESAAPKS